MRVAPALFHGETVTLRRHAAQMLEAAVAAADPAAAVARVLCREGTVLRAGGWTCDLQAVRRVVVVGAGKGAVPMAQALDALVGPQLAGGLVVTKYGHGAASGRVDVVEAGHPLPDAAGERAARRVLAMAEAAGADDLLVVVLSGGGSALLPLPAPGVALEDKVATTDLLLRSGATITEVNTVRKHLSRIKGGWLARAAAPARILTLVLSDVLGNPLDAIASGPTVPDPTTFADALAVVERYGLRARLPAAARAYLEAGAAGERPETPKPDDPAFARAHATVVGDLQLAVGAAAERARSLGYRVRTCGTAVQGEARAVGARFGEMVRDVRTAGTAEAVCLVMGGETTVTVRGGGRGGRNQEFALAAAWPLAGVPGVLVAAFGTDGTDGPTDAAGAVADGTTLERARARGLDPARALAENDTYPFFAALGDLIVTGPTRTNVNDVWLGLVAPETAP
ncbi:MAG: glycerate kinase [Armatimonadota bacterium]|nr:glycerate kinase [Armatimonadota bacterium]